MLTSIVLYLTYDQRIGKIGGAMQLIYAACGHIKHDA